MPTFQDVLNSGTQKKQEQPSMPKTFAEVMSNGTQTAPKVTFDAVLNGQGGGKREHVTFYTAEQVDNWINTSSALGQKASKYYGSGGWVEPNLQLVTDIDNQLKDASKVRQYFTANSAKFEDPDATVAQVDKLIEGLTALRDGGKNANEVFGKFKSADAYNSAMKQNEYAEKSFAELESLKGSKDVLFTTEDGAAITGEQYYNTRAYFEKVNEYNAMSADKVKKAVLDRQHLKTLIDNAEKRLHDHITKYGTQLSPDEQAERNAIINDKRMLEEEYAKTLGGAAGVVYTTPEGVNITPERLLEEKQYQEGFDKMYAELSANEDWAEQSRYITTNEKGYNPDSDLDLLLSGNSVDWRYEGVNTRRGGFATLNEKEIQVFNYLYHTDHTEGKARAFEWVESLSGILDNRRETKTLKLITDSITNGGVYEAAAASMYSVGTSLSSSVEYIGDALKYIITGKMDTNDLSQVTSTIRGAVAEKYDWNIPALDGWDAFDFLYNTGMSMADSVATMPIGGWGSAAVLGLTAAASATNEALERGLDDKHAFWGGVAAGAFETIFEKVSIGQFESLKDGITGGFKDAVWNIAKSMLVNASEETLTEVANILYDAIANENLSAYETSIRAMMAQGVGEEEARKKATLDLGVRVAEAAGSGTLMGFGFGTGGSAISYGKTTQTGKALNNAGMGDAVVALGKTMEDRSKAQAFAMELDGKKKVSNADVGKLYGLISEQAQDMTPEQIFAKAKAARAAQGEAVVDQQAETAQYAILKDTDGNLFVDVTEDIFNTNDGASVARVIQNVISEKFHNLVNANGQSIQINKTTNDEFRQSRSARIQQKESPQAYGDKLKTIANSDEILRAAKNWIGEQLSHERKDDIVEFARADITYRVGDNGYVAEVLVGTRKNGSAVLYDIVNIAEKEITEAPVTMVGENHPQRRQSTSVNPMVSQESSQVKYESENSSSITPKDVVDFNAATGMKATPAEFAQAGAELAQDQTALKETYAEREAGGVEYTPPKAKDIKPYSTEDTKVYSRVLSREVYFYDGASYAQAEAGFAENGVVYINKNAPVNRNTVAVVLAHEYVHTIERTWNASANKYTDTAEYTELKDAVFASDGYRRMLLSAGEGSQVSISHEQYLQQLIDRYAANGVTIDRAGAESEAVAKYLSEYLFQSVEHLTELAQANPTTFEKIRTAVRRFFARLAGKRPTDADLKKLESLFAKAAKAANSGAVMQNTTQYSLKGHKGKGVAKKRSSWYSQFESEAMSWANRADRKPGDITIVFRSGSNCSLIEATENGYVELARGKPKGVQRKYELYRERNSTDGSFDKSELNGRGMRRDSGVSRNGRMYGGNDSSTGTDTGAGFDTATSDEYLRSDNQETPVNNTQYSLPSDAAYMDAVNRGDMDTAQRMVDEAASVAMPDAPRQTTAQTHVDPDLANVIEAATAGVEGRKPNLPQRPVKPLDPETARLNEIATAAIEHREPNLTKADGSTPITVDNKKTQGYNDVSDGIEAVKAEVTQQQQNVNSVAKPIRIKCIRDYLAGKHHPVTGVLYTERIVAIDGQQYIVVAPKFDSAFDTQLPHELRYASDDAQFRYCTYRMREVLKTNVELKELFTEEQLVSISKGKVPDGYTWHHDVEVGKMQLVLTEIHSKTGHTGGRSLWGGGKDYR